MILEATAPSPVYVLGSGKCIKIKDIVESLLKISGKTLTLEVEAALLRKVDPVKFMANASLAGQELNWRPELSIDSTLNEIYKIA
jgi:UDP-glucose 4-epimerase